MTPEQAALLRKARDSLQAAQLLAGERFHGFAVSRAYYYLIDGHSSRNVGDYDTGPGLSADDAAVQIARAEEFLELAALLIGPVPPQKEV